MKVVVLYRPNSEHGRLVEEFIKEFKTRYSDHQLEVVDVDSKEGITMVELYGAMQYPSIIVVSEDGGFIKMWSGDHLPLISEVSYYTSQVSGV